jgi:hypothetical protein
MMTVSEISNTTKVPDAILHQARSTWAKSAMHLALVAQLDAEINGILIRLSTCLMSELSDLQGQIKGHKSAIAILNNQTK